jgi:tRNA(Ile)-lysidine synthase
MWKVPLKLAERLEREKVREGKILAAVSGGADSLALLHGLRECGPELRLEMTAAHLNHQLRGVESNADAAWLEQTCAGFNVPLVVGRAAVTAAADAAGDGIEEAARRLRYEFLCQTARETGCRWVAVAHSADDQAETILHHVIRGTGLAGLRGMRFSRELQPGIQLIRPLLDVSRTELRNYLAEMGQNFREDSSNSDPAYTRNRIRQVLLPLLEEDFNPQVGTALRRLGQQAADMQTALETIAHDLLERVLESETPHECRLKWQPLAGSPRHLLRELFAVLWRRRGWTRQAMTFDHWDQLAEIAQSGGAANFPGGLEIRREGRAVLIRKPS